MDKVAIGRLVLTNREHIIALEPLEYFDEIEDVKLTKDMLDLARHIVDQKSGSFEPGKFEDHYETALIELISQKRAGKPITAKEKPAATNVVNLMEALRRSVGQDAHAGEGEQAHQEAEEGIGWPEGNADADRRQEAGCGEKAAGQAPQLGLTCDYATGSDRC